eukprot:9532821-Ditylum_brightwellii.AAC.1
MPDIFLQNLINTCDTAIKAASNLQKAKENATAFIAKHQALVDQNVCFEFDITELCRQVLVLEEEKVTSGSMVCNLEEEKELAESKNMDLNDQLNKLRANLSSAESKIKLLNKEK